MKDTREFWITNLSNRNVSLSDLYISVPAMSTVNLLDSKHYSFTFDQLQKSATEGSLFRKQKMIVLREIGPYSTNIPHSIQLDTNSPMPQRSRSAYEIKEEKFEELEVSDEEFAEQTADSVSQEKPVSK
jgi:hypothetical protein